MDALLKFPDQPTAIEFGKLFGATSDDDETAARANGVDIHVIGTHYEQVGTTTDLEGEEVPNMVAQPGWWLLVRMADGFPVTETLGSLPENLRPEVPWLSVDENGEPVERPVGAPVVRWA
jgi:hypothetical protein